jgi:hypothetical protein
LPQIAWGFVEKLKSIRCETRRVRAGINIAALDAKILKNMFLTVIVTPSKGDEKHH